jgi:7-carboxy-7-deazaguanine synthase
MILKIAKPDLQPEIFYSIQGEGKNIGQPSIFIRTSLCNLHCIWCDTDYTWNWESTRFKHHNDQQAGYQKFKMSEVIQEMTTEEVTEQVRQYACKNIVLTGGEPMMQQEALIELMEQLGEDYWFEIETNGTLLPDPAFDQLIHQYNVSPKLANSGNSQKLREKAKAYQLFTASPKAHFKFVVADQSDLDEIRQLIHKYDIPAHKVYLMPEGNSTQQLQKRQEWIVEVCKQYGYHFTSRLHVLIYGSKRGV